MLNSIRPARSMILPWSRDPCWHRNTLPARRAWSRAREHIIM